MGFGRRREVTAVEYADPIVPASPQLAPAEFSASGGFPLRFWAALARVLVAILAVLIAFNVVPSIRVAAPEPARFETLLANSDLKVSIGASLEDVQKAYPDVSGLKELGFNDKIVTCTSKSEGISFHFRKTNMRLKTIRLDPSFQGQVLGMKIGDHVNDLVSALGQPTKEPWDWYIDEMSYYYKKSEKWAVNFSVTKRDFRSRGGRDQGQIALILLHE